MKLADRVRAPMIREALKHGHCDPDEVEEHVNRIIDLWTNSQLLEEISAALEVEMKKPHTAVVEQYDAANLAAAKIIAADPGKYAGGCLEWARLVLKRLVKPPAVSDDNRSACCGAPLRQIFVGENYTKYRCQQCGGDSR